MIVSQSVLTNTTGFLIVLKSVSPIIIVGRCMQYASRSDCYFTFKIQRKGISTGVFFVYFRQ